MFLDPRVVGGALVGDVEGDLDPALTGLAEQPPEVLERPQLGVHGLVASLLGPDRPGAAHVVGGSHGVVVLPLPLQNQRE